MIINNQEVTVSHLLQLGADYVKHHQVAYKWLDQTLGGKICAACTLGAICIGVAIVNEQSPEYASIGWGVLKGIPELYSPVKYGADQRPLIVVLEYMNDQNAVPFVDTIHWLKEQGL